MKLTLLAGVAATVAAGAYAGEAFADEGMWTFDNFPAAKVKEAYGVDITPAWLDHVRGAAVRLSSGCSASAVTATGLVLTNNHCVADCAQTLSSPGHTISRRAIWPRPGRRNTPARACRPKS